MINTIGKEYEGEQIEFKVRRILQEGEPIKDGAPEIFTERKNGVNPAHNIKTDKYDLAMEAMEIANKAKIAKRGGALVAGGNIGAGEKKAETATGGGEKV